MGGELLGDAVDLLNAHAADLGVLLRGLLIDALEHERPSGAHVHAVDLAVEVEVGLGAGGVHDRLAGGGVDAHAEVGVGGTLLEHGGLKAGLLGAQELAVVLVGLVHHDEQRGVGEGAVAGIPCGLEVGEAQVLLVVGLVVHDPLHRGAGEGGVGGSLDRHPVDAGHGGRDVAVAQHRVQDVHLALAVAQALGRTLGDALEAVARGAGELAHPQNVLAEVNVGDGADGALLGEGLGPLGAAAGRAVADLVHGAEALHEAARGAVTAVGATAHEHELVGDGAQVGALGVDEGGVVMNGLEALDLAVLAQVGEELAALGDLGDELIPGDGRPLVLAALTGALEGRGDAVGLAVHDPGSLAAGAHGAVRGVAIAVGKALGAIRVVQRCLERQARIGAVHVIGVAAHREHATGLAVDLHAVAAVAVASQARAVAHDDVVVDGELTGLGVDLRLDGLALGRCRELRLVGESRGGVAQKAGARNREQTCGCHAGSECPSVHADRIHVPPP